MKRGYKALFLLMLSAALTQPAAAGLFAKKQAKEKPQMPPRPVETAVAAAKDVPNYIDSFGNLQSLNNVDIKSQVTGEIKKVCFTEGQEVSKGDLLFVIDPQPYKAQLDKAQASLEEDTADLELKKITVERNEKLLERELISKQDFDKYTTDVKAGEARINLDKANIELARINLAYCYLSSPINGRTGKRQVDPGNIVFANSGTTLVNVKTIDTLYIDFTIPETQLATVRRAMAEGKLNVLVSSEGDEKYVHSGELHFLDNAVDNTTGTILLRAMIQNKERGLWSGQFVNVRLILGEEKGAVVVPYETVQLGQDGSYLFVVDEQDKAVLRIVTSGSRWEGNIVIKQGLETGEKVVTVGQMGLSPGAAVIDTAQKGAAGGEARKEKIE